MNRFFRKIILGIITFAIAMGLILMLRFGSPVFKVLLIAAIVGTLWFYINYLKADRKKVKEGSSNDDSNNKNK